MAKLQGERNKPTNFHAVVLILWWVKEREIFKLQTYESAGSREKEREKEREREREREQRRRNTAVKRSE